jgi:hypothetical protein
MFDFMQNDLRKHEATDYRTVRKGVRLTVADRGQHVPDNAARTFAHTPPPPDQFPAIV